MAKSKIAKVDLVIIDAQNDFCDTNGSLFVPGADKDCERLGKMIKRLAGVWNDIHATLDSHNQFHIAHPIFWIDGMGNNPKPFTKITNEDVKRGRWMASVPGKDNEIRKYADYYTETLAKNGRYDLTIWPPHCLIGDTGFVFYGPVRQALLDWEKNQTAIVNKVSKGSNWKTEHYSAVMADVPDPADKTSQLNTRFIDTLGVVDKIVITGQALSHCVANTFRDVIQYLGKDAATRLVLIEDCCSNVTGFEKLGDDFMNEMIALGMEVTTSDKFLA